ncbi:MAG: V-type ATP synthase subunit F [Thermoplasmata archaeon]
MPDPGLDAGRTVVLGERELAIGFRLIGLKDVVEVTPQSASAEFQRVMSSGEFNLVIASHSVRQQLSDGQRALAEATLRPLVVFVPGPTGAPEVESIEALAKRVLGVSLKVPS